MCVFEILMNEEEPVCNCDGVIDTTSIIPYEYDTKIGVSFDDSEMLFLKEGGTLIKHFHGRQFKKKTLYVLIWLAPNSVDGILTEELPKDGDCVGLCMKEASYHTIYDLLICVTSQLIYYRDDFEEGKTMMKGFPTSLNYKREGHSHKYDHILEDEDSLWK